MKVDQNVPEVSDLKTRTLLNTKFAEIEKENRL